MPSRIFTSFHHLLELYVSFVKIGGFTLGGGYAMIPIIQNEAVDRKKWISDEEMTDYIAIGQSLPGVVGINTATAVGNRRAGAAGAVAATLGMITPSLVVIVAIAIFFEQFQRAELVQQAFRGVRAAVAALIIAAVARIFKAAVKNRFQMVLAALAFITVLFLRVSPPYVILSCAAISVAWNTYAVKLKSDKARGTD